jgi:hypothetical protein
MKICVPENGHMTETCSAVIINRVIPMKICVFEDGRMTKTCSAVK